MLKNSGQCPSTDLDPFAAEFLEDPYPHHEALREAGPVVWIEKYDLLANGAVSRGACGAS